MMKKNLSFFFFSLILSLVVATRRYDKCYNEHCCIRLQQPNSKTGQGYLEFEKKCLDGGLHCVDETGCQLCRTYEADDKFRPVCDRFKKQGDKDDKKCHDDECCKKYKKDCYDDFDEDFEYDEDCHWGGDYCEKKIGCRWCKKDRDHGDYKKPICKKYKDDRDRDEEKDKCHDDDCCKKYKKDHYHDWDDEMEYDEDCHWGGDYCEKKTGCRWCKKDCDRGDYKKPVCKKYKDDRYKDDEKKKCFDDDCCSRKRYGEYLEYNWKCLWGGKDCFHYTGCCWCRKKDDHNDDNKPICERYNH